MYNIDLHMHSKYSDDGEFTPLELIQKALESNIDMLAIADHNSVKALRDEKLLAKKYSIKIIPAIELDCVYKDINLHVLGYGIHKNLDNFDSYENEIFQQERLLSAKKIEYIQSKGIYVDLEQIKKLAVNGVVTGEMIAEVALKDKKNYDIMKDYLEGGSRGDNPYVNFYWDYFGNSNLKPNYITLQSAIQLIKNAGGISILAHPGQNIHEDMTILDGIVATGVDGLEAFSSYHSIEQTNLYRDYAKEKKLIVSLGSDFHGKTKPAIHMGNSNVEIEERKWIFQYFEQYAW